MRERDGAARGPIEDAIDKDEQEALEAVSASLEGKTTRQKNPHAKGSLAFAAWVFARLGGWTGYYGSPVPSSCSTVSFSSTPSNTVGH